MADDRRKPVTNDWGHTLIQKSTRKSAATLVIYPYGTLDGTVSAPCLPCGELWIAVHRAIGSILGHRPPIRTPTICLYAHPVEIQRNIFTLVEIYFQVFAVRYG